jgi:hypothetical protein
MNPEKILAAKTLLLAELQVLREKHNVLATQIRELHETGDTYDRAAMKVATDTGRELREDERLMTQAVTAVVELLERARARQEPVITSS